MSKPPGLFDPSSWTMLTFPFPSILLAFFFLSDGLFNQLVSSFALPVHGDVLSLLSIRSYDDLQISGGVGGTALEEAARILQGKLLQSCRLLFSEPDICRSISICSIRRCAVQRLRASIEHVGSDRICGYYWISPRPGCGTVARSISPGVVYRQG
jgi:hypothetical protein